MGWTSKRLAPHTSKLDAIRAIEGNAFADAIMATNIVGSVVYAACRTVQDPTVIIGAVILVEVQNGETAVKVMEETTGPFNFGAAAKVLDVLTPTTDADALAWRKACREEIANRPKPGDLVRTDCDLAFQTFELPIGAMGRVEKVNVRTVNMTLVDNNKTVRVPLNAVRLVGA